MKEVLSLISNGESQYIEFKVSFQKEIIESVVAFANTKGGKIIVGVDNKANILGISITNESIQDYINTIKQNTQPNIIVDIDEHNLETKIVLAIDVKEYPLKPISYKNRYFKRVKNSNHIMSLNEISNEHLKTINSSWDYHIDNRHNFDDISQENIDKFIKYTEKNLNKTFTDDPYTILKKYELIKDGKLTFGAYLLFTSNDSAITSFQIGRFKDSTTIIDNIDINTNIFTQVDIAIEFIKKHLMTEFIITGEPQRTVQYDYPLEAIREIVINMIVHRDYQDSGNSIIKIFDDKIEFFNPGRLYDDLTIEDLHSGNYSSRTRNRAIARAFKEAGIIERYGSGIARIKNECKLHEVIQPKLEELVHGFRVTLYKEKLKTPLKTPLKTKDNIVKLIKSNKNITIQDMSNELSIGRDSINEHLLTLKQDKIIKRVGSARSGYWVVIDD